ncbi:MAG: hypothetical protein HKN68_12725 [Saprospiraceae bacterium]|nr:hypothetical protein [Saprospiraceae bacterium]
MKIKRLKLFSNDLIKQKEFFEQSLGLRIGSYSSNTITFHIGWSNLVFEFSPLPHHYHYCFLIPSNGINEALVWRST